MCAYFRPFVSSRRFRLSFLVLTSVAILLTFTTLKSSAKRVKRFVAATPASGTLSPSSPSINYTGGPFVIPTNSTDSAFVEGDNYVIYHNLLVTDGTLRGTWSSNPIPFGGGINDEGDFCGAQLQYVGSVLPQVRLTAQVSTGGQLKLEWSQGRLLETTNLATGTWIAVPGAATSYTVAPTETHKFYRVQVSP